MAGRRAHVRSARCTKKKPCSAGNRARWMSHIEQARGCLPTAAHHEKLVISKTSFRFNWSRAYSLLLTPTAFDEPVFRLPVACVACIATATSNCQFKLPIQTADPVAASTSFVTSTSVCCAYCHFVDCHCRCFCYFCYDCWQPAVLRNAEGNRVDGLLNRRAMERSIGATTRIQSAEARAIRGSVRPFVRTAGRQYAGKAPCRVQFA